MSRMLTRTGTTPEGKPVVDFFQLVSCRGVSFEDVFTVFDTQGFVPCWASFWMQAMVAEWGREGTLLKLEAAIKDVYGESYFQEWLPKTQRLLACLDGIRDRA